MILCLADILRSTDLHYENFVEQGENPIVVDLETLLHPCTAEIAPIARSSARKLAQLEVADSLLRTGLLPHWHDALDGSVRNAGVLGGGARPGLARPRWRNVNTDGMELVAGDEPEVDDRAPTEESRRETLVPDVVAGFAAMYDFVQRQRDELLSPAGPLHDLARCSGRFVFRPTAAYTTLIRALRNPGLLRDGADLEIEVEILGRDLLLGAERKPALWALFQHEKAALLRMDVPLFRASADAVVFDGLPVRGCLAQSGMEGAFGRLGSMDPDDRERQCEFLGTVLGAATAVTTHAQARVAVWPYLTRARSEPCVGSSRAIAAAADIARRLCASAVRGEDESVAWVGLQRASASERLRLQVLGPGFYEGLAGVALFLAAAGAVTGNEEFWETTARAGRSRPGTFRPGSGSGSPPPSAQTPRAAREGLPTLWHR